MNPVVAAVMPSAGVGQRLGSATPKALQLIGDTAMLVHSVLQLDAAGIAELVVVAAPSDYLAQVRQLVADPRISMPVIVLAGGASRGESVRAALAELPQSAEVVVIHDAARPFAPPALFTAVVRAVIAGADAAVPALALADTVKLVDSSSRVVKTLPRRDLRAAQTPQAFRLSALLRAHERREGEATDDAELVEALGGLVVTVPGHPEAFKVTAPLDLVLAEALLARRRDVS